MLTWGELNPARLSPTRFSPRGSMAERCGTEGGAVARPVSPAGGGPLLKIAVGSDWRWVPDKHGGSVGADLAHSSAGAAGGMGGAGGGGGDARRWIDGHEFV